ncbi:PREDICTED: uncharacterized protein LOC105570772 isoform X2 [Vollenhovia emeryi]|uniref:uncharacterized protein LOC105570772 isoform X2 n=1 Tax=Vollenhovia emeryi TaxID=411798 RepID=UPI0005F41F8E|nr:PREDICTED: uncharacterized protein LOC105570772 isoform X2 [Vollenhovia emeryi]
MAQYFNVVTNASGTFTLEEVPGICTDEQRIQLVVGDVNNSSNGSQRLVTYATAQNRRNVFIIKTNDITGAQDILPSAVNAHIVNKNIVSIESDTGVKAQCKNEGQQMQLMKIQNANTIVTKQSTLLQERNQTAIFTRSNIQNNITSGSPLYVNSGSFNPGQTERRIFKSCPNKNRQVTNNIVGIVSPSTPDVINVVTMENRIQNSNATTPKSTLSVCKTINSQRQNVTVRPVRTSNPNMSQVRSVSVVSPDISKTPTKAQPPDMEHLNEQIKQAKFKQLNVQKQHIEKSRFQQNNTQRQHSNTLQPVQPPLNTPIRRIVNSAPQRTQQIPMPPQQVQKPPMATSTPSSAEHNTRDGMDSMEVDSIEHAVEKGHVTQQSSPPRLEHENSASESIAYLQKTISDPANAIVQHQIQGNTAKMLVMLATGEQRLITFDIPNEDCTVHDLLDQVRAVLGKVCFYKDL